MKYLLFCILGMLASCTKEKSQGSVVDTNVDIIIENVNSQNLLLQTTPNFITPDSIKLIYLIDDNMVNVYNPDMDCPRAVCNVTDSGSERIRIFPNDIENEEYPITYIRWENGDLDTLKCHFVRSSNDIHSSIICDKVWFNDLLMFPDNAISQFGRTFKIIL
jgi:hypothetical protein